jgi:two-component system, sensor histidine kinase YesM
MKKSWFQLQNYRIEQKLLLTYPILIILSILVVSVFAILFSREIFKERTILYSQEIIRQITHNIDTQLKRIDQDSYIFIQDEDIRSFLVSKWDADSAEYYRLRANIQQFLTHFLLSHENVESVYLINNRGDVITTTDALEIDNYNDYRQHAMNGAGSIVWLNTITSTIGNRVIPAVRTINDLSSMKDNGTLVIYFRESAISGLLADRNIGVADSLKVLDPQGYIVSSDVSSEISTRVEESLLASIAQSERFFFKEGANGNAFYNFYRSDLTNWTYLYRTESSELYRGVEVVRNWIILVALLFTIGSIVSAKMIARNISRPIQNVIKEMRNIERNGLLVNLIYEGKDELSALTHTFNNMTDQLRRLVQREAEIQRMQHELEMRALQAEINPHFLYNTLEAINWMGRMNRIPKICDMTTMLAEIMRYSIDRQRDLVTIADELRHTEKYLGIQQIRFNDQLKVFIDVDPAILSLPMPKLTLQPIVENAIIHGFGNKVGIGRLRLFGGMQEGKVVIIIEDNGCGMEPAKIEALLHRSTAAISKSIGFFNVNKRIQLIYGEAYGLDIKSAVDQGTRVSIHLPLPKGEAGYGYVQGVNS